MILGCRPPRPGFRTAPPFGRSEAAETARPISGRRLGPGPVDAAPLRFLPGLSHPPDPAHRHRRRRQHPARHRPRPGPSHIAWHTARDQIIQAAGVLAGTVIDLAGTIGLVLDNLQPARRRRVRPPHRQTRRIPSPRPRQRPNQLQSHHRQRHPPAANLHPRHEHLTTRACRWPSSRRTRRAACVVGTLDAECRPAARGPAAAGLVEGSWWRWRSLG
jgi:hypothetical protein